MSVNSPLLLAEAIHTSSHYIAESIDANAVQRRDSTKIFIAAFQRKDYSIQVVAQSRNEKFIKKLIKKYNEGEKDKTINYYLKHSSDVSYDIFLEHAEIRHDEVSQKNASHVTCCVYPPYEKLAAINQLAFLHVLTNTPLQWAETGDNTKAYSALVEKLLNMH